MDTFFLMHAKLHKVTQYFVIFVAVCAQKHSAHTGKILERQAYWLSSRQTWWQKNQSDILTESQINWNDWQALKGAEGLIIKIFNRIELLGYGFCGRVEALITGFTRSSKCGGIRGSVLPILIQQRKVVKVSKKLKEVFLCLCLKMQLT